MFEALATYAIVAVAAAYAAWQLIPGRWRTSAVEATTELAWVLGLPTPKARREPTIADQSPCGSCTGCRRSPPTATPLIVVRRNGDNG
ncbi:MAG: hypothetical protein E6Q99_09235 [Elusimicrobia bacterium]|nr:MAG: hypothetical protein E6Q99_09235 [Elusimicrobiota bacterium]